MSYLKRTSLLIYLKRSEISIEIRERFLSIRINLEISLRVD
jgi:hypothetical protein